jgi:hydroxymethylbilane synthase
VSAPRVLRIATRGSRLALWQAEAVSDRLRASGARTEVVVMTTTGDRSQQSSVPGDDSKRQS